MLIQTHTQRNKELCKVTENKGEGTNNNSWMVSLNVSPAGKTRQIINVKKT